MKCPTCNISLVMTDRQGVEIDYCPQCRGVWLDRGELDKILERSVADASPQPPVNPYPQQQEYHKDSDYYKYKKKKRPGSFLGDIFDF